jgi:hypothetical protein
VAEIGHSRLTVDHFERDAYIQWLIPGSILIVGLLSTLLGLVCFRTIDAARADRCLDAGGSYDYERDVCDLRRAD